MNTQAFIFILTIVFCTLIIYSVLDDDKPF